MDLHETFMRLRGKYLSKDRQGIAQLLSDVIAFLDVDIDRYPDNVRREVISACAKLSLKKQRALSLEVDFIEEWNEFVDIAKHLSHHVFSPWLKT